MRNTNSHRGKEEENKTHKKKYTTTTIILQNTSYDQIHYMRISVFETFVLATGAFVSIGLMTPNKNNVF